MGFCENFDCGLSEWHLYPASHCFSSTPRKSGSGAGPCAALPVSCCCSYCSCAHCASAHVKAFTVLAHKLRLLVFFYFPYYVNLGKPKIGLYLIFLNSQKSMFIFCVMVLFRRWELFLWIKKFEI